MRVLVTAGSKHGATTEIAAAIGRRLGEAGLEVDVLDPDNVTTLDGIDAAVVGSGVYAGSWLASTRRLIERHEEGLRSMPVWIFSSGPLGDPPKPAGEESVDVSWVVEKVNPREHRIFAGKLDKSVLGFAEKAIILAVRAEEGDYRDWDAIESWSSSIATSLTAADG